MPDTNGIGNKLQEKQTAGNKNCSEGLTDGTIADNVTKVEATENITTETGNAKPTESGSYSHKQNLDGLNEVRKHLTSDVDGLDFEPNKAMMEKIEEMLSNNQELTGAYKDFYEHELTESMLMKQGYGYRSTVSGTIKTNLSKFHKKFILFICFFECQAPMFSNR